MGLEEAIDHLLKAKRISAPSQSYAKDNPGEWGKIKTYLEGGARPSGIVTEMGLGLLEVEDVRRGPTPPTGDKLHWAPPNLSNPVTRTLTASARAIPTGSGEDLRVLCSQVLPGNSGEWHTYNDVVAIAGEIDNTISSQTSGAIIPRQISGIFHVEGWKFRSSLAADFITSRQRARIIQLQAIDATVTDAGTSYHADFFQTQITQIDELRVDRCTIRSDYQSFVLINESPIASSPDPSFVGKTIVRRTVLRQGPGGNNMWFFLSKPPKPGCAALGPVELYDVWAEDGGLAYPHTDFNQWDGGGTRFGAFRINKQHANGQTYPFWRFSTSSDVVPTGRPGAGQQASDCNVRGDGGIWIFPAGGNPPTGLNLGAPANAGLNYVSPGYL